VETYTQRNKMFEVMFL